MNEKQYEIMKNGKGFIAALDQSGGSTPKALLQYGLDDTHYHNDEEMFALVHDMRTRIITSPSFRNDRIIAAILFENTMDREIEGKPSADYLWDVKGIIPILKIDKGLAPLEDGVQLMKPIPNLEELLEKAVERHIFGTKERSVIKEANPEGIKKIVAPKPIVNVFRTTIFLRQIIFPNSFPKIISFLRRIKIFRLKPFNNRVG